MHVYKSAGEAHADAADNFADRVNSTIIDAVYGGMFNCSINIEGIDGDCVNDAEDSLLDNGYNVSFALNAHKPFKMNVSW